MRLKTHYYQTTVFDLIYKFNYYNHFQIPQLKNIHINISDVALVSNKNKIFDYLFFLELLTNKRSIYSISKKTNIMLKIKKNTIIGCFTHLNTSQSFNFFEMMLLFILPFQKNFSGINIPHKNQTMFRLKQWYNFLPKNKNYNFNFYKNDLQPIQVQVKFNKLKQIKTAENCCLLSSFNIPVYNNNQ